MKYFFILLIRLYQLILSPLFGGHCRFVPSCSEYARQAFGEHGVRQGVKLSLKRLGRCHPWGKLS